MEAMGTWAISSTSASRGLGSGREDQPQQSGTLAVGLTAVASGAAPGDGVCFQHGRLDSMFLRQMDGARQTGITGTDDGHIDVHVAGHRTIVLRPRAGGVDPVGRRVVSIVTRPGIDQWVVAGIVTGFWPILWT